MFKAFLHCHFDTKLVLITTLLSNIGIFMVIPFLAVYLNNIETIGSLGAGIIIGAAFWCQRAGSLLGGLAADYLDIKTTMILGLAIRIPGYMLVGLTANFYLLMLSCVLIGIDFCCPLGRKLPIARRCSQACGKTGFGRFTPPADA